MIGKTSADFIGDAFDAASEFRSTLRRETDRGCALMAAAHLDDQLAELLGLFFVNDLRISRELLKQSRPLGTFSARIDLVYAIGLLSREEHRCLYIIRKIRNDFGHVAKPLSFDAPSIAQRCKHLEFLSFRKRDSYRTMFTGAVMAILAGIDFRKKITEHRKAPADISKTKTASKLRSKYASENKGFEVFVKAVRDYVIAESKGDKGAMGKLQAAFRSLFFDGISEKDAEPWLEKLTQRLVQSLREDLD